MLSLLDIAPDVPEETSRSYLIVGVIAVLAVAFVVIKILSPRK
ncbi:MAG: hypothetical protein ACI8QS_000670 [Planctomycetota bacterium]|jgi:hypothetical protein